MPTITLNINSDVYKTWQHFLKTSLATKLHKAKKLDDLVTLSLITCIEYYINKKNITDQSTQQYELTRRQKNHTITRQLLSKSQKKILPLFNENSQLYIGEIIRVLNLTPKACLTLIKNWLNDNFLCLGPIKNGIPTYVLSYQWQIQNLTSKRPSLNTPRRYLFTKYAQHNLQKKIEL